MNEAIEKYAETCEWKNVGTEEKPFYAIIKDEKQVKKITAEEQDIQRSYEHRKAMVLAGKWKLFLTGEHTKENAEKQLLNDSKKHVYNTTTYLPEEEYNTLFTNMKDDYPGELSSEIATEKINELLSA